MSLTESNKELLDYHNSFINGRLFGALTTLAAVATVGYFSEELLNFVAPDADPSKVEVVSSGLTLLCTVVSVACLFPIVHNLGLKGRFSEWSRKGDNGAVEQFRDSEHQASISSAPGAYNL
jgi:hypothetical protein